MGHLTSLTPERLSDEREKLTKPEPEPKLASGLALGQLDRFCSAHFATAYFF
jgi:hypothetical protein